MKPLKRGTLVEVTWVDSASTSPWVNINDAEEWAKGECICYTTGYVFLDDAMSLTLVQTRGESWKTVAAMWAIPRGCIKKVRKLS